MNRQRIISLNAAIGLCLWLMALSASAFYNPTAGQWLSRDPIGEEAFQLVVIGDEEDMLASLPDDALPSGDPYLFVLNNPILSFDHWGLWSPGAHDALIEHALKATVKRPFISIIQKSSRDFDAKNQGTAESHMHSMRQKGQSSIEALKARDLFVAFMLEQAKKNADAGECKRALQLLGEALHPIMDSSSPMHTDPSGEPKVWNPLKPWGHSPNDLIGKERKQDITITIYTDQDKRIKNAFDKVFQSICPCRKEVDP